MKRLGIFTGIFCILFALGFTAEASGRLKLATTTSTENSGLLEAILPPFEKETGLKVDVISVGMMYFPGAPRFCGVPMMILTCCSSTRSYGTGEIHRPL